MTNRAQITRQAARDGVPAPTVERDYVLAHIIAALGALDDSHGLVFKGGTALRLCYFEDYRYSADLDFSVVEGDREAAYATIEAALTAVTGAIDTMQDIEVLAVEIKRFHGTSAQTLVPRVIGRTAAGPRRPGRPGHRLTRESFLDGSRMKTCEAWPSACWMRRRSRAAISTTGPRMA